MVISITIGIIAHNEEDRIETTLQSLKDLDKNILIVDDYSDDNTVAICKKYNCEIIQNKFVNFSQQRNFLIEKCKTEWILMIDADETINDELAKQILKINSDCEYSSFKIKRNNYFNNYKIKMFSPDYQHRLFSKSAGLKCKGIGYHEKFLVQGKIGVLQGCIKHRSYRNVEHYISKLVKESKQMAIDKINNGKKYNFIYLFLNCIWVFVKFYILKLGFLDGIYGLLFTVGMIFYKILIQYYMFISNNSAEKILLQNKDANSKNSS